MSHQSTTIFGYLSGLGALLQAIPHTSDWFRIAAATISAIGMAGLGQQAASVPGIKQEFEKRAKDNETKFVRKVDIK